MAITRTKEDHGSAGWSDLARHHSGKAARHVETTG